MKIFKYVPKEKSKNPGEKPKNPGEKPKNPGFSLQKPKNPGGFLGFWVFEWKTRVFANPATNWFMFLLQSKRCIFQTI